MKDEISFIDLLEANNLIFKKDIKGKAYGEVAERIKAFRYIYPKGKISTNMLSNENGVCVYKASVFDEEGNLLGEGTACEKEGSSFINKTSYIENCETSAVGRALGFAGFAFDTAIVSYEELSNAELQQELLMPINKVQLKTLQGLIKQCQEKKVAYEKILKDNNINKLEDLTVEQYGKLLLRFKEILNDEGKGEDK